MSRPHLPRYSMTGYSKQTGKATQNKLGRSIWGGGEKGGGGGERMERGISEWPCWWCNMDHHTWISLKGSINVPFAPFLEYGPIRWQDKVTNTEVFKRSNCISIIAMLLKSCLCWTGHVIRMEDHCIPKQLLFGELEQGHRKRYKDTVKVGLKWCNIPPTELVATALDRQRWRMLTRFVIFTRGRASPPSTVHQRSPPLSSLYSSDNRQLPVPSLRTALQVEDQPVEPLPYPQM